MSSASRQEDLDTLFRLANAGDNYMMRRLMLIFADDIDRLAGSIRANGATGPLREKTIDNLVLYASTLREACDATTIYTIEQFRIIQDTTLRVLRAI